MGMFGESGGKAMGTMRGWGGGFVLRYPRKAIFLDDPHRILPSILTDIIEAYSLMGRTSALRQLLDKALERSHKATKLFLFAEMRYYRQRQQYDLLIKTFVQHFYVAGVPREEVQRWYDKTTRNNLKGQDYSLMRLTKVHPHTLLWEGKLWPDLEQCHLVCEALVIKAQRNPDALMTLYKKSPKTPPRTRPSPPSSPCPCPCASGPPCPGPPSTPSCSRCSRCSGPTSGTLSSRICGASTSGPGCTTTARSRGTTPSAGTCRRCSPSSTSWRAGACCRIGAPRGRNRRRCGRRPRRIRRCRCSCSPMRRSTSTSCRGCFF
jgi:hypothetical protein